MDDLSINLQYVAAETCQHVLQKQVLLGALKGGEEGGLSTEMLDKPIAETH